MKKLTATISLSILTAVAVSAQTTNYVETFDPAAPASVTNSSIALGGSYSLGIGSNVTTIVNDFGIWGFTANTIITNIGGANGNVLQPQLNGKNNARLAGVFLDPTNFNGVAGGYALNFDIIGADAGKGHVYVGQGSGYDLTGTTSNAIDLDLAAGGFGAYLGLTAVGDATVETLVSEELDEQTSTNLTYTFEYDGSSAVAIAFGGYNTAMQIDNVVIYSTNTVPRLEGASDTVMFGALANVLTGDIEANNAFVNQIGAGEIVQWNGVNSDGGSFGASGNLHKDVAGASLTNSLNDLVLTSQLIASSDVSRTNTYTSAAQLGIGSSIGPANFQQSAETVWSFDFSRKVMLKQVVFSGLDGAAKDRMRITIDGTDYDLSPADTDETDAWTGNGATEVYTFASPVEVAAGADISVATHSDQATVDPVNNKWGLYGVIVTVPEESAADLYDDWLADYVDGMGGQTNLTDNPDNDAIDNLYEYAQGGNPTNGADMGHQPIMMTSEAGGTNYIEYVYYKRDDADARGLTYYLELTDDLTSPAWTNAGYTAAPEGAYVTGFNAVTNWIPATKSSEFIQLQIELDL